MIPQTTGFSRKYPLLRISLLTCKKNPGFPKPQDKTPGHVVFPLKTLVLNVDTPGISSEITCTQWKSGYFRYFPVDTPRITLYFQATIMDIDLSTFYKCY